MNNLADQSDALLQLENRHEELLRQLEKLDKRVEQVLAEWTVQHEAPDPFLPAQGMSR